VNEQGAATRRDVADEPSSDLAGLLFFGQEGLPTAEQLVAIAGGAVTGAHRVCLTVAGLSRGVRVAAHSDDVGPLLAALQSRAEEGPGLEAVERNDVVHVPDLESDGRWPVFARQARELGVRSLVSVRSPIQPRGHVALTFFADQPDAFSAAALRTATILGSFAGLILEAERQRERATNLEVALESNRHIGTAIGILMAREVLTADQAFDRLREVSQRQHRKLRDVAEEVARVGELPRGE
jgi:hypothetical protein